MTSIMDGRVGYVIPADNSTPHEANVGTGSVPTIDRNHASGWSNR